MDESSNAAELEQARAETRSAFENRALMYYYIFDEMSRDIGPERATEIMKRAIHRRGLEVGRKYEKASAEGGLPAVAELFCSGSPCQGTLFTPGVESLEGDTLVLRMESCPLVDAWESLGLEPDQIDLMCEIAAAVDEGTFEAADLELTFKDRLGKPGSQRCLLELRKPAE